MLYNACMCQMPLQVLGSIRTVRSFSAEQHEVVRYSARVADTYKLATKIGVTNSLFEGQCIRICILELAYYCSSNTL
jgi:hypothetical protein